MIQIIDNFISDHDFEALRSEIMGTMFPWFYQDNRDEPGDGLYQLTHMFADKGLYHKVTGELLSSYTPLIQPILTNLGGDDWLRIKLNLNPQDPTEAETAFHRDFNDDSVMTAVFYLNDKGWTEFEDGTRVHAKPNRILLFTATYLHRGNTCADDRRVVLNLNFRR
jgi:hypothetical protein